MSEVAPARENAAYECTARFSSDRIHAAAVFCSDGRFGDHVDEFLHHGLNLPRYDRVTLPGGPAVLARHDHPETVTGGVMDELKFLVDAHELDHVVLIGHHGCAFYSARLQLPDETLEQTICSDLEKAAACVRRDTGVSRIDVYFARRHDDGRVTFEAIAAS